MNKLLKGMGTSPGKAKGKVKIISDAQGEVDFNEGDILVTRITDPTMIMMMSKAGAIVCEIGGITSHPSIVSREMGIPCVVSVADATKVLKDGMEVEINGARGTVTIIDQTDKTKQYPKWIDDYARSVHRYYQGIDFRTFEPFDVVHFHPLYSELWIERLAKLVKKFRIQGHPMKDAINHFPIPSSIRAILCFMVHHMENCRRQSLKFNQAGYKEVMDFLVEALNIQTNEDKFALKKSIGHSAEQVQELSEQIPWQAGSPEISYQLGQLYLACSGLVNGLMNDWCTDNGIEVWGPYDVSKKYGAGSILVVREFPNLKPESLWLHTKNYTYRRILIYTIYKDVDLNIQYIGCHTIFKGDLKKGLIKYAVIADGKPITDSNELDGIIEMYLKTAEKQYKVTRQLNFEELKQKALEQEHYQLFNLFKLVGEDWRPNDEIKERVRNQPLVKEMYPLTYPDDISLEEISKIFGIDSLKCLYN
ncbi:hypothetical protein KKG41_02865 [Patescibacteria group bacterium]|nr:hypothetical protein [Patescibacteria group bacterium]MBU1890078.1 hypothetical protein [Patescibacteria group bacterium]